MSFDSLGDRMKNYYENITRAYLPKKTYTIIRLDGKAFHTFTKKFKRPYDEIFSNMMNITAQYLCENKQCAQLCGGSQESPFTKLQRHRSELDRSLSSIKGFTEESKLARMYIVGQIEALDFAMRLFEV